MDKLFLMLLLLLFPVFLYSQEGNEAAFFQVNGDTITIYFNEEADVTTKANAGFYRKGTLDTTVFNFSGKLTDYYMDNQLAYECFYSNTKLYGSVRCFYPNGNLKYYGYFHNSMKDSIWNFYYDNGNIEKIIHFENDVPFIQEFHKKNGKMVFNDGNGKFNSRIRYGKDPLECNISGKIHKGKMDGAWHWNGKYAQSVEYYKNGEYVESESYRSKSEIKIPRIITITGFSLHENLAIFDFKVIPQENLENIFISTTVSIHSTDIKHQPPQYKGSNNFREEFSTDLAKILLETKNRWHIDNFWSMIQFSIDEENRVQNIDSYSNKEEISHAVCSYLSDNKDFTTAIVKDKAVKCDAYLAVFFMNNSLYIPEYRYNNSRVNLFDLK